MNQSFYRFVRPSFLGGMARALDIGGTVRFYSPWGSSPAEQDRNALMHDWQMIGNDLRRALDRVGTEVGELPARRNVA